MKTILKKWLSKPAKALGTELLTGWSGQRLLLPFYHMVSDDDPVHVKYLYPAPTTKRFKADLDFLRRHFRPVSHAYLTEHVRNRLAIKENCFFLSFDDGLREFYDVAAPILEQRGIPATCFINTAFIDNRDMLFRMKASILIGKIKINPLTPGQKKLFTDIFNQYNLRYNDASDLMKVTDHNRELLDAAAAAVEVSFPEYLSTHRPYLTTSQIHELVRRGFSIGAHSVSHPCYQILPEEMQVRQTLDCLDHLATNFNVGERLFSFPYTDFNIKSAFFEKIREHVDLSFGTAGLKTDSEETNLQRISMEAPGYRSGEEIVSTEQLYFIIKRLAGKHKIRRN